jgi:hypothetical protein
MSLFSSSQVNQLASGKFQIIDLLDLHLFNPSTRTYTDSYYLSTLPTDREFTTSTGTEMYLGGFLVNHSLTNTSDEVTRKTISFTLSGLSATFVSMIQDSLHSNAPFTLYKVILDETNAPIGNGVIVYKGRIQSGSFEVSPANSAVQLHGSHTLYNFNRTNNVSSHQDNYIAWCKTNNITTYGTEFADIDKQIDIPWGRKA